MYFGAGKYTLHFVDKSHVRTDFLVGVACFDPPTHKNAIMTMKHVEKNVFNSSLN